MLIQENSCSFEFAMLQRRPNVSDEIIFCEKHVAVDMLMSCDILAGGHVQGRSYTLIKQILDRF